MKYTRTSPEKLQTIDEIFHYAINHKEHNKKKSQTERDKKINNFLKNL